MDVNKNRSLKKKILDISKPSSLEKAEIFQQLVFFFFPKESSRILKQPWKWGFFKLNNVY